MPTKKGEITPDIAQMPRLVELTAANERRPFGAAPITNGRVKLSGKDSNRRDIPPLPPQKSLKPSLKKNKPQNLD